MEFITPEGEGHWIRVGDVVRWEALSSAGSGALQHKRTGGPLQGACKRAKSSPDLSQTPSAADTVEEIPLFSEHCLPRQCFSSKQYLAILCMSKRPITTDATK